MTLAVWLIDWRNLTPLQAGALKAMLTEEEHARASRFHFPDDRDRFSLGRGLLRLLSAQALDVAPGGLCLATERRGKPYWAGHRERLEVNVSHSGDWIAVALSSTASIGIDVQEQKESVDMAGITRVSMHPNEQIWFGQQGSPTEAFYRLWTLREAALKATGDGFFAARTDLDTLPLPKGKQWVRRAYGDGITLDLRAIPVAGGYACALAIVVTQDVATPPEITLSFRQALPI